MPFIIACNLLNAIYVMSLSAGMHAVLGICMGRLSKSYEYLTNNTSVSPNIQIKKEKKKESY